MQRILLTGMSGTGKSSLIAALAARGHRAIDLDTSDWSEWVTVAPDPNEKAESWRNRDWMWREARVRELLSNHHEGTLFVSGTSPNQGHLYPLLECVILLTAPAHVITQRLQTRTNNPYGKHPDELARVLDHIQTVEPLLRRRATHEVDTTPPLDEVVATILRLI